MSRIFEIFFSELKISTGCIFQKISVCAGILQYPCWFRWGTCGCGSMFHRSWFYPHSPLSFNLCTPHSIMFRNNLDMYPLLIVSLVKGLSCLIYLFKMASLMNFCSAKNQTLQSFVMKKADTANFCSQKKRTLQSLGGGAGGDTIQLCIENYKIV